MKLKTISFAILGGALLFVGCSSNRDTSKTDTEIKEQKKLVCYTELGEDSNPRYVITNVTEEADNKTSGDMTQVYLDINDNKNGTIEKWERLEDTGDGFVRFHIPLDGTDSFDGVQQVVKDSNGVCFPEVKEDEEQSTQEYWNNRLHERYNAYTEQAKENPDESTSSSDGIRPEFQESMDKYLEFFKQYAEFMKTYKDSNDPTSMIDDYTGFMNQYVDTMESFEALEDTEMSSAELKLYINTNAEIQKLLLSAY